MVDGGMFYWRVVSVVMEITTPASVTTKVNIAIGPFSADAHRGDEFQHQLPDGDRGVVFMVLLMMIRQHGNVCCVQLAL